MITPKLIDSIAARTCPTAEKIVALSWGQDNPTPEELRHFCLCTPCCELYFKTWKNRPEVGHAL